MALGKDFEGVDFTPDLKNRGGNIFSFRASAENMHGLKTLKNKNFNVSAWVNELVSNGLKHNRRLEPCEISNRLTDFRPVNLIVHKNVAQILERAQMFGGTYDLGKLLCNLIYAYAKDELLSGDCTDYISDDEFFRNMVRLGDKMRDIGFPPVD